MQQIVIDPGAGSAGQVTWHADGPSTGTPRGDIAIAIDENAVDGTRLAGNQRSSRITIIAILADGCAAVLPLQEVDDGVGFLDAGKRWILRSITPLDEQVVGDDTIWPDHPLNRRGLIPGYRVVLLQRLADPLSAYDADTNPYRTVDSSAVDLFVFNGLMTNSRRGYGQSRQCNVTHQDTSLPDSLSERLSVVSPCRLLSAGAESLLWRTSVYGRT